MGARTDTARAEVIAAREGLVAEVDRLEAAARSAVDIPARIRRAPAQTAGAAAGAAFLLAGGPGRLFRRARRLVLGPEADLPKSMLPDEVEKTLRKLGRDGEKVRGTLEREFADYLESKSKARKERDLGAVAAVLLSNALKPASTKAGKELAARLISPDGPSFSEAVERVRARRAAGKGDRPAANGDAPAARKAAEPEADARR